MIVFVYMPNNDILHKGATQVKHNWKNRSRNHKNLNAKLRNLIINLWHVA